MSKGNYSKEELIKMCDRFLEDPSILYKQSFIISLDTIKNEMDGERTEFIAEYLNSKIAFLKNIQTVPREKYKMNSHDGKITNSNQREKNLAKELYNQSKTLQEPYDFIGIIEDYETPLKKSNDDIGVGKIDLLSVSKKESCVYILELKKEDSDESMLRCVLEAYTYLKQVNEI